MRRSGIRSTNSEGTRRSEGKKRCTKPGSSRRRAGTTRRKCGLHDGRRSRRAESTAWAATLSGAYERSSLLSPQLNDIPQNTRRETQKPIPDGEGEGEGEGVLELQVTTLGSQL